MILHIFSVWLSFFFYLPKLEFKTPTIIYFML